MFCDNSVALLIANEPRVQMGARHYHRRYHYVRECIELGEINLLKFLTDDNLADPFTKALPKGKLTQHARSIGLRLASSFISFVSWIRETSPHIDVNSLSTAREQKFAKWLKEHVFERLNGNYEHLKCLAWGPLRNVKSYEGYLVNGYMFHTKKHDRWKKSSSLTTIPMMDGALLCYSNAVVKTKPRSSYEVAQSAFVVDDNNNVDDEDFFQESERLILNLDTSNYDDMEQVCLVTEGEIEEISNDYVHNTHSPISDDEQEFIDSDDDSNENDDEELDLANYSSDEHYSSDDSLEDWEVSSLQCMQRYRNGRRPLKVYKAGKRLLYSKRNKAISFGKGASKVSREVHSLFLKGLYLVGSHPHGWYGTNAISKFSPDTELVLYPLQDKLTSGDKSLGLSAFKLSRIFFSFLSSGSSSCWRSYGAQ
ncbi:hypothetical protein Tco_0033328 [Tanacetum coccineum]